MPFVEALKEACFVVFPIHAVLRVLACAFGWRRLQGLGTLGVMMGCVLGAALAAQMGMALLSRSLVMGLMVGVFHYLFGLLERKAQRRDHGGRARPAGTG